MSIEHFGNWEDSVQVIPVLIAICVAGNPIL